MLMEISCDFFKKPTIYFHHGLNVVLGDNTGSNSIGKSCTLHIIDFIFGGSTYLNHHQDVVDNLGHHRFEFYFKFSNKNFYFIRNTSDPKTVFECDRNYKVVDNWTVNNYHSFLKQKYTIENNSFREVVGLYSRIWGKKNLNIKQPLHSVPNISDKKAIIPLVKLFNLYSELKDWDLQLKDLDNKKKAISNAQKQFFLPKLSKTQYKQNQKDIQVLEDELKVLKDDLLIFVSDVKSFISNDIVELTKEKNKLDTKKTRLELQLKRTQNNLYSNLKDIGKNFEKLQEYFPNININRLNEVNSFHSSLTKILREELKNKEIDLQNSISNLIQQIKEKDSSIKNKLKVDSTQGYVMDKIIDLTTKINLKHDQNSIFEQKLTLDGNIKENKANFAELKEKIYNQLEEKINKKISIIYKEIYPKC